MTNAEPAPPASFRTFLDERMPGFRFAAFGDWPTWATAKVHMGTTWKWSKSGRQARPWRPRRRVLRQGNREATARALRYLGGLWTDDEPGWVVHYDYVSQRTFEWAVTAEPEPAPAGVVRAPWEYDVDSLRPHVGHLPMEHWHDEADHTTVTAWRCRRRDIARLGDMVGGIVGREVGGHDVPVAGCAFVNEPRGILANLKDDRIIDVCFTDPADGRAWATRFPRHLEATGGLGLPAEAD